MHLYDKYSDILYAFIDKYSGFGKAGWHGILSWRIKGKVEYQPGNALCYNSTFGD